jgi:hypothetical protein
MGAGEVNLAPHFLNRFHNALTHAELCNHAHDLREIGCKMVMIFNKIRLKCTIATLSMVCQSGALIGMNTPLPHHDSMDLAEWRLMMVIIEAYGRFSQRTP